MCVFGVRHGSARRLLPGQFSGDTPRGACDRAGGSPFKACASPIAPSPAHFPGLVHMPGASNLGPGLLTSCLCTCGHCPVLLLLSFGPEHSTDLACAVCARGWLWSLGHHWEPPSPEQWTRVAPSATRCDSPEPQPPKTLTVTLSTCIIQHGLPVWSLVTPALSL